MRFFKYLFFLWLLSSKYSSTESQVLTSNTVNLEEVLKKIAVGGEEFSLELFKRISEAVAPAAYDFMISPFSIWSLLVLIAEGANGNTLEEIRKALRIQSDITSVREGYKLIQNALNVNTSTVEVSALQAIFSDINRPVDPEYEKVIERSYKADLVPVDFQRISDAKNIINSYVSNATKGLIENIVEDNDLRDGQMVLISAIFFRGQWKIPFNKSLTKEEEFFDEDGKSLGKVNMMTNRGEFLYAPILEIDSHVLELPYGKEERLAMIIFLPKRGARLTSVVEKISTFGISKIYNRLRQATQGFEDDEIDVTLPRFSTTSDFILNIILEQMGMIDVFDAKKSDLSKISSHSLYLSRVFHKTKIEVNEEGTTAAAITAGLLSNKKNPPRFYLNRPFAYIIIEKTTNSLIFCGEVRNPTKNKI